MNDVELTKLEALYNASTPGKWMTGRDAQFERPNQTHQIAFPGFDMLALSADARWNGWDANAAFIAAAHEYVPALIADLRAARAALLSLYRTGTLTTAQAELLDALKAGEPAPLQTRVTNLEDANHELRQRNAAQAEKIAALVNHTAEQDSLIEMLEDSLNGD
jgi:hypothetical protein